ncbi:hypothetical protein At1D1460_52130 (plasmid) [Agrobacterium tumefaciens]|nr:hypothetical protein At1D1460_52130 [Agrobacterium tumefaciens]AYM84797.1 hypothetical protein At12D1_49150 [Agrobacterium tumefaciens]QEG96984.1 hypothetical protein AgrTiSule1_00061 [Agrobacterium tumefaciens]QEG97186.1 hypothetical protein AgrTiCFBP2178_00061 [Agrobacterium tumefaciens]QEG97388.1 hypothetical protein AgrTiCFBP1935_00061 [Agrobacterium tumefaciens]
MTANGLSILVRSIRETPLGSHFLDAKRNVVAAGRTEES